jgi:hypothetical protein
LIVSNNKLQAAMKSDREVNQFLSQYDEGVFNNAMKLRDVVFANLPEITEQIDISARMIAYCYGQKYAELICVIIPSKKGLKLGFNRGVDLPDPDNLLQGAGKISRYVEIKSEEQIKSQGLKKLLQGGLKLYKERMATAKRK